MEVSHQMIVSNSILFYHLFNSHWSIKLLQKEDISTTILNKKDINLKRRKRKPSNRNQWPNNKIIHNSTCFRLSLKHLSLCFPKHIKNPAMEISSNSKDINKYNKKAMHRSTTSKRGIKPINHQFKDINMHNKI